MDPKTIQTNKGSEECLHTYYYRKEMAAPAVTTKLPFWRRTLSNVSSKLKIASNDYSAAVKQLGEDIRTYPGRTACWYGMRCNILAVLKTVDTSEQRDTHLHFGGSQLEIAHSPSTLK